MIKIIIFIIICNIYVLNASAEEWDSATFTLSMENPAAYKGNYSLEVLDFDGYGMAGLNISRDGIFIGIASLENNDTDWFYMDNGRIRLKSENITDRRVLPMFGSLNSPQAKFTFATQKIPGNPTSLALSISTDKKEYLLDQEIIATIDIRNVGDTKANDISLRLNSELLIQGSPQSFNLDDGDQKSLEIKFRFPPLSKASYNIAVNTSWSDTHGARYFIEDSQAVKLKLPLEIRKSATGEVKLGKQAYVSLSVENVQTIPLRVSLSDALPISFTPVNGTITDNKTDLRWEFDLAPRERRVFTYQMNASQSGAHRLPNAHIVYMWGGEEYTNSSKTENIILVYKGLSYQEQEFGKAFNTTLSNAAHELQKFNISGYKINDTNANGTWDAGEQGIQNWEITLYNSTLVKIANTTTNATGFYNFSGLVNGTYRVAEEVKPGWINTSAILKVVTVSGADVPNQNFTNQLVTEVSSGEDFSNWVNESGFALRDIKVKNETLNVFVFIPRDTKILNATNITIKEAIPPKIPSNLIYVGEKYYHLGPEKATFVPFIYFNVPFKASMTDSPSIYRYSGNWNSAGGTVNGSRVYTNLSSFSVYAVFVESSHEVKMSATIRPSISIEVTPSLIDFGELAPGDTSSKSNLTIKNRGASNISVTADVIDDAGNLYADGIYIDDNPWKSFSRIVLKNNSKIASIALKVPEIYEGVGSKEGRLMFWAER